jgi:signal transduction histidine kinase
MGQFFLVSAILLVHSMLVQGAWVAGTIESEAKRHAAGAATLFIDHFIAPILVEAQGGELTPERQRAIASAMQQASVYMRVVALKIWSPQGRILYATDTTLIGQQFPITNALRIARAGTVAAEFDELDDPETAVERAGGMSLLEIYVPVRDSAGRIFAVVEFYEDAQALRRSLAVAKRNTWLLAAVLCLFVIAALSVIFNRAAKVIERQRRSLVSEVQQTSEALRQNLLLQARVERASRQAAEENERFLLSLGADLHDGPAQLMGYALLRLDSLPLDGADTPATAAARDELEGIRSALNDALNEVRNICAGLSMPEIEALSLADALASTIADHERRTRTTVATAIHAGLPESLPHFVKVSLCRFVQEGLNNAFRHAGGKGQFVEASADANTVFVRVQDSGPGITAPAADGQRLHLGLAGLANRIESWGGTIDVTSVAGEGTWLTAAMPLLTEREEAKA